jgi:hypothetical protein
MTEKYLYLYLLNESAVAGSMSMKMICSPLEHAIEVSVCVWDDSGDGEVAAGRTKDRSDGSSKNG